MSRDPNPRVWVPTVSMINGALHNAVVVSLACKRHCVDSIKQPSFRYHLRRYVSQLKIENVFKYSSREAAMPVCLLRSRLQPRTWQGSSTDSQHHCLIYSKCLHATWGPCTACSTSRILQVLLVYPDEPIVTTDTSTDVLASSVLPWYDTQYVGRPPTVAPHHEAAASECRVPDHGYR